MLLNMLTRILGNKNQRELKRLSALVDQINLLETQVSGLTDQELQAKTGYLKNLIQQENNSLDQILPQAFACVREAGKRALGLRHYDVQLIGGIVLHRGKIAEMQTGEGKTLVATLPAYLNSLAGGKVHIVTVNDYLAKRDAAWMQPLYNLLGIKVGSVYSGQARADKQAAYQADVIYGTNNEFGFDYLRDQMVFRIEDKLQGTLSYAIIDEVDSILIDEARTPLIISGAAENSSELYQQIDQIIPLLTRETQILQQKTSILTEDQPEPTGDYIVDEKNRQIEITEAGHEKLEQILRQKHVLAEQQDLYGVENLKILHHIQAALKAHVLFQRNVHYIVKEKQIVIVDEHTGRSMPGRRWSEGIHQALEAKEHLPIQHENQTLASTTFQNYFRLYDKLAGMTGTADTEAVEFHQIYGLDVVIIPPNKPNQRIDHNDLIYMNQEEKYQAIVDDIKQCHSKKQPVLVGTASIESSEKLSSILQQHHIQHAVLNAKQHLREAHVIAQAGKPGAITIATNMAGRGTDIILGGNLEAEIAALQDEEKTEDHIKTLTTQWQKAHQEVLVAGGLKVIGSERHESRRIDNQLRGRSGRQGDPGATRFFLSLEDNLLRIFASGNMRSFMQKMAVPGQPIEHKMINNAIAKAQRRVERHNFDIRKQLLEYDDIANEQRQAIYQQRHELMTSANMEDIVLAIYPGLIQQIFQHHIPAQSVEEHWDITGLKEAIKAQFGLDLPIQDWLDQDDAIDDQALQQRLEQKIQQAYQNKKQSVPEEVLVKAQKHIMLQVLDVQWKEHLAHMDQLRQAIQWRGYAQKNPKQEYKREAFVLFQRLLHQIQAETIRVLFHLNFSIEQLSDMDQAKQKSAQDMNEIALEHQQPENLLASQQHKIDLAEGSVKPVHVTTEQQKAMTAQPYTRSFSKIGRNEPCPCKSGKKFKHCHGKLN